MGSAEAPLSILFLIRDLHPDGAQQQLSILARGLHQRGHRVTVAVFYGDGRLEQELGTAGVEVHHLDKRGRWDIAGFLLRLLRLIRQRRPMIIHGYLPVANLLALLSARWRPGTRVVWGLRSSAWTKRRLTGLGKLSLRLENFLSRFVDLCICNSWAGHQDALARGFPIQRLRVISNGIDTEALFPHREAGASQRRRWGVEPGETLIGLVGRLDPLKNHPAFLEMAAYLLKTQPALRFVCVGDGPADYRQILEDRARTLGLDDALILAGACVDMCAAYNALDLLVSSSITEGFANVIGEAMACQIPCVVTAVGDNSTIVADTGVVVPSAHEKALAGACTRLLALSADQRQVLGQRARDRILQHFSIPRLVTDTEALLNHLAIYRTLPTLLDQPSATDL